MTKPRRREVAMKVSAMTIPALVLLAGVAVADEARIAGTVKAVDATAKTLTLQVTPKGATREVVVHMGPGAKVVRFARPTEPGKTGFVEQEVPLTQVKPGWVVSATTKDDGDREVAEVAGSRVPPTVGSAAQRLHRVTEHHDRPAGHEREDAEAPGSERWNRVGDFRRPAQECLGGDRHQERDGGGGNPSQLGDELGPGPRRRAEESHEDNEPGGRECGDAEGPVRVGITRGISRRHRTSAHVGRHETQSGNNERCDDHNHEDTASSEYCHSRVLDRPRLSRPQGNGTVHTVLREATITSMFTAS